MNYARQKTWVVPDFAIQETLELLGREPNDTDRECILTSAHRSTDNTWPATFRPAELERFRDPVFAKQFRYTVERSLNVSLLFIAILEWV